MQQCIVLLSEIIIDVVFGLALDLSAVTAFETLLIATLVLSCTVVVSTLHILCCEVREELDDNGVLELSMRDSVIRYDV
jgi:hypothetical protein